MFLFLRKFLIFFCILTTTIQLVLADNPPPSVPNSASLDIYRIWNDASPEARRSDHFPEFMPMNGRYFETSISYEKKRIYQATDNEDYSTFLLYHNLTTGEYGSISDFPTYPVYYPLQREELIGYIRAGDPPHRIGEKTRVVRTLGYIIVINEPGVYLIRFGGILHSDELTITDPEVLYNSLTLFDEDTYTVNDVPDIGADDAKIVLTDNTWYSWLPVAPVDGIDNKLNLNLRIVDREDPELRYRFCARLYNITWYPGMWTNDFEVFNDKLDSTNASDFNQQWDDGNIWYYASEEKWADLKIKKYVHDEITKEEAKKAGIPELEGLNKWNVKFNNQEKGTSGYYDISYNLPVSNDDLVSLEIQSFDFGASGRLSMGLAIWDSNTYPSFEAMHILGDDKPPILPIPRDEETKITVIPDTFKTHGGDTLITHCGDLLGDAWEELYRDENGSSGISVPVANDSIIYSCIEDCKKYSDDSYIINSFFPQACQSGARQVGDRYTNLEKYRGIYGVSDRSNLPMHVRLSPHIRNIFVVPFEEKIPRYYRRRGDISYLNRLASDTLITQRTENDIIVYDTTFFNNVRVYSLLQNTDQTKYYNVINRNVLDGKTYEKVKAQLLEINSIMENFKRHKRRYIRYCVQTRKPFGQLVDFVNDVYDTTYTINHFYTLGGITFRNPTYPDSSIFCYTFHNNLYDIVNEFMAAKIPGYISTFERSQKLKELKSVYFAHEVGHSLNMDDAKDWIRDGQVIFATEKSIMYYQVVPDFYPFFIKRDYGSFMITNYEE